MKAVNIDPSSFPNPFEQEDDNDEEDTEMGLDPACLHSEHIARLLSPEQRKKAGVQTSAEAADKQRVKSERELQDQIYALLTLRGVRRIVRSRMDRRTTTPVGTPDFLFSFVKEIRNGPYVAIVGIPCAIEVKTDTGRLSPDQESALKEYMSDGWRICLARSVDDVRAFLDDL